MAATSSPRTGSGIAEYDGFADPVEFGERCLDCRGGDVLAAADDHFLGAPGDPEETVLIDPAEVAGAEPALGVDRRDTRSDVAGHLGGAPDEDFPVGVVR